MLKNEFYEFHFFHLFSFVFNLFIIFPFYHFLHEFSFFFPHNIYVLGLLLSRPWVSESSWLETCFSAPPWDFARRYCCCVAPFVVLNRFVHFQIRLWDINYIFLLFSHQNNWFTFNFDVVERSLHQISSRIVWDRSRPLKSSRMICSPIQNTPPGILSTPSKIKKK